MTVPSGLLRVTRRVLLWAGAAAIAGAAGAWGYAGLYQGYQSWTFEQRLAAARDAPGAATTVIAEIHDGDVIGRLEVPRVGISVMVFHGVEETTLLIGAGHVPGTPLPGVRSNVVIAAHRDTYFRALEGIRPGDTIRMTTARGVFNYTVVTSDIVDPTDTRPMESRGRAELTLITCYPFYFVGSAPKRFIVRALPL